jgi:hypothetical protein
LTAHAASFVVHIWSDNFVLSQVVIRLEVFVALVAVVMIIVVLLVSLHVLHGVEVEVAIWERALDSIRIRNRRHLGLCCSASVVRVVACTTEFNAHLDCEGRTLGVLVVL